jgi:hypothetical protein
MLPRAVVATIKGSNPEAKKAIGGVLVIYPLLA